MDDNENDIAKNFFNSVKMNDHLYASSWIFTMVGIIIFTIVVALNVKTNNAKSIPLFTFIFAVIALMIVTFFKTISSISSRKDDSGKNPHIKVLWQTIQNWIPGLLILTQLGLLIELNVNHYKKTNYNSIYGLFSVIFIIIQITIYINYVYNQYIIGNNNTTLREKFLIYYPWFLSIFVGFFLTSWFYAHTKSRITDDY